MTKRPETRALAERINELRRHGLAPKQIAYEVGRTPWTVYRYLDEPVRGKHRWFSHRVSNDEIAAKLAEGLSLPAVERELGYAPGGLYWRVDRYGLRPQAGAKSVQEWRR